MIVIDDEGNVTVLAPTFDDAGDWGPGAIHHWGANVAPYRYRMTPRSDH